MSTGHLRYEKKSDAELYKMLGQGDTPELYARKVKLDTSHSVPYGGGASVDGKTVYIDETLYAEIMCKRWVTQDLWVTVKGMSSDQIVQAILEHEHTEQSIDSGDNPVDVYVAAHEFATAKEERFVRLLGVDPERYEAAMRPALERCARRDPKNPPKDLWCGPYLDDPTPRDKEILRIFRAKGVLDAFKTSKNDVHYGVGANECKDCAMFGPETGKLRTCDKVCGLVRDTRHCDLWTKG